jgi:hypothetical protein
MIEAEEIARQHRVVDQMVTMYSVLRDRYAGRAMTLTLGIFLSSAILVTCTFLPSDALLEAGVSPKVAHVTLGFASGIVLFLSVADLALKWREVSQHYGDAADRLAKVKAEARTLMSTASTTDQQRDDLSKRMLAAMEGLPRIPDRKFLSLKAYHQRKVELSRMSDRSVGAPLFWLRLRLLVRGLGGERQ